MPDRFVIPSFYHFLKWVSHILKQPKFVSREHIFEDFDEISYNFGALSSTASIVGQLGYHGTVPPLSYDSCTRGYCQGLNLGPSAPRSDVLTTWLTYPPMRYFEHS